VNMHNLLQAAMVITCPEHQKTFVMLPLDGAGAEWWWCLVVGVDL